MAKSKAPAPPAAAAVLRSPVKHFRAPIARGLSAAGDGTPQIDPAGGDQKAGIIRGCAVITRGEALGHGFWIDEVFLGQVNDHLNAAKLGTKSRFTHPGLSADGMGKLLGRAKGSSIDGDVVRADLNFSPTARATPSGDLAGYVLELAAADPAAFGMSIVFEYDWDGMEEFRLEHMQEIEEDGRKYFDFISPDADNVENLPHARLSELLAVDVVDEPAANPEGLFHRGQEIPQAAEALLSYALGLSAELPVQNLFDIDPDRAAGFVARFLDRANLEIVPKEGKMPVKNSLTKGAKQSSEKLADKKDDEGDIKSGEDEKKDEEKDGETQTSKEKCDDKEKGDDKKKDDEEGDEEDALSKAKASLKADGKKFVEEFGERGAVLFAEGHSFAEAQQIVFKETKALNQKLSAESDRLKKQLAGGGRGEDPLSAGTAPAGDQKVDKLSQNLGTNLGRFAAAIKLPK